MTETPPTETPDAPKRTYTYLPVLPDGWSYRVFIDSDEHAGQIVVGEAGSTSTLVHTTDGTKRIQSDTLADAVKVGVRAAKALTTLRRTEDEFRAARAAALAAIGGDDSDPAADDTPTVEDPVEAHDLAKGADA